MNRQEHLLTCLSEECAEVIKEVSKILRFGANDVHPDIADFKPNIERLENEINDVFTIVGMLKTEGIDLPLREELVNAKEERVEKYMLYAKERGTLI